MSSGVNFPCLSSRSFCFILQIVVSHTHFHVESNFDAKPLLSLTSLFFFNFADILRTMRTSEDTSVYDKVVNAIFDEEMLSMRDHHQRVGKLPLVGNDTSSLQCTYLDTELCDYVVDVTREVFRQHCAKRLEILPMRLLDDSLQHNRFSFSVKLVLSFIE